MQPSFPSFWRTHHYYPSWPHISQDSLCTTALSQRKKKMITVRSSGADLIMMIMITLLWVQITGLLLHGALLTGNTPAIDRAISPLLLESAGLKTTWTRPAKVSLKELPSKAAKAAAPGLGHSYCFFFSPLSVHTCVSSVNRSLYFSLTLIWLVWFVSVSCFGHFFVLGLLSFCSQPLVACVLYYCTLANQLSSKLTFSF